VAETSKPALTDDMALIAKKSQRMENWPL